MTDDAQLTASSVIQNELSKDSVQFIILNEGVFVQTEHFIHESQFLLFLFWTATYTMLRQAQRQVKVKHFHQNNNHYVK